jgi:predicted MPP superfamily phosphohydrolase
MARRSLARRSAARLRTFVWTLAILFQLPVVWALGHLTGRTVAVGLAAAIFTVPFLATTWNPLDDQPRPFVVRMVQRSFFAWWAGCVLFTVASPLALALHALAGEPGLGGSVGVTLLIGVLGAFSDPRLVEHDVHIPGLPPELDGYRVAQISDIHCGAFTPPERVARWVERLNAVNADLIAVTGDLITSGDRYTEAVAGILGQLRARDGVYACMGNHDYFTDGERFVAHLERAGLTMLRNRGLVVQKGSAEIFVAGVDDTWTGRADVDEALAARSPNQPVLLLLHDPNLWPQAAAAGVHLTLSGHTHGGQIAVPGFHRRLTPARLITRFPSGFYKNGDATLYVSCGAGTTGPPVRVGARAELTVLTLRAA